ncbi:PREDICTED: DNA-directed RNA polymerase I subunit RPA12-like [Priapulus caudatus]|uniref:DNA-directed RNA polymerase subunit n=1 Tax=Priapulus caudatus TaxID=37621 RepID=A0ABM1E965_PRICU|nr:PREDICTED: DNA-directed RNA polymerase I subunit RPA12-like [Priapulus caudatus]
MSTSQQSSKFQSKPSFTSDIEFCSECGAILPLPGRDDVVVCRVCSYAIDVTEFAKIEINTKIVFNAREEKQGTTHSSQDIAGPLVDRKCSKCGHEGMTYTTRQTRSVDEGQTVFYSCPACNTKETEYS